MTFYSTGGGGTVLEHRYGAYVLAHLLAGAPLNELHDHAVLVDVHFQARHVSAVDDFLIRGALGDGTEVRLAVAVRRNPKVQALDSDTQALVASFLRALDDNFDAATKGVWRCALASAITSGHARELLDLTGHARGASDVAGFRAAVPNRPLRDRLKQVDKLVAATLAGSTWNYLPADEPATVTWVFLKMLRVRLLRLEGGDHGDRTAAIGILTPLTVAGTPDQADQVHDRLVVLAGNYAPAGTVVDETGVRSAVGAPLAEEIWVGGDGRRVARPPAVLRYLKDYPARLNAERYGARRALGLTDAQVVRSLSVEPPLLPELDQLQPGETLVIQGPIGSGKTDIAIRWLLERRPSGSEAWGLPVPVFLRSEQLQQSTIIAALEAAIGFSDAAERFGVDLVIDGLDERPGSSIVSLAAAFAKQYCKCRVVLTTRDGELVPSSIATVSPSDLDVDDVRRLVGAILEKEPWRVGYGWTPDFFQATRRPLFALLAATYGQAAGDSRASLVARAVEAVVDRESLGLGLELLAIATVRNGRAVDPRTVDGIDVASLNGSPVVTFDGPRVRFVLPIFEQWFAAGAVLSGKVDPVEFAGAEAGFARWRYVLAVALSIGSHETIEPWMDHLVRANPAAASWVVREGVRTDLSRPVPRLGEDAAFLGEQIWNAMSAWMDGLAVISPVLGPGVGLGVIAPGTLDGVRLVTHLDANGGAMVGWFQRLNQDVPAVSAEMPEHASLQNLPRRVSWGEGPRSEAWTWRHTLENMNHKQLTVCLTSGSFLARSAPPGGIVRAEHDVWMTVHALGFNDVWPARISKEVALARVEELLTKLRTTGNKAISVTSPHAKLSFEESWLRAIRTRIEGGEEPFSDIWPKPDLEGNFAGPITYSPEQSLKRANAVYEGAAIAYQELHEALFPRFGNLLGHSATFPARLEGTFESRKDDVWGGDIGSAHIAYWLRPIRDGSQATPLVGNLGWAGPTHSPEIFDDNSEAFTTFMKRRHDDPIGSAFELTTVHASVVDNSFWGRRPSTHLAVEWLLNDLKVLGWGEGGSWIRIK